VGSRLVYDIDDIIIRAKQTPIEWCKFEISEPLLDRATNWDNHRSIIGLIFHNNFTWIIIGLQMRLVIMRAW